MAIADTFLAELEMEAQATRRVLERVPQERLAWRPHEKSSSLGQLALHVASLPQQLTGFVAGERVDFGDVDRHQPVPASKDDILSAFEGSLGAARNYLGTLTDARAAEVWTLAAGGKDLFAAPRAAVIRSFLFNHLYHHRGQLLVYLRLLDVPLPPVYGPTADENPFASVA
jgi:uncharacterized damage-inducible protein DinB